MMNLERTCTTAAHWSEQQYEQLFQESGSRGERLVLVMRAIRSVATDSSQEDKGQNLLGFLVARHIAPQWELENIVVACGARRKGAGKRLLDTLLAHAMSTNSDSVFLEVRESNTTARSLYESRG